ncbi:MAG: AMP-binding protein [Mycobacterium sp.]
MAEIAPIGVQVSRLAAVAPDDPAITCAGRTITRGELDASTNRLARAYAELGVGQGDYLTIVLPNSIEFLLAAIAAWKLGAIPQPLPTRLPDAEFEGILRLRPRALLVGRTDPRGEIPSVPAEFTPDAGLPDAALPEAVSPSWKAMASGGSTGRPKLIEAGGDSRYNAAAFGLGLGVHEGDTTLVSVPMSHNTGMIGATVGLLLGHLVVMPRFEPDEFLRLVTEHRVNFLATVPTIMHRLLPVYRANPDAYDLSSIQRFWHVGAPCPLTVKEAWIELLGPDRLWEFYGGTELQAFTVISGGEWLDHPGSVGKVVSGEIEVLDDEGRECPPGVVGEVFMRPAPGSAPTYRYIGATAKSRDGFDSIGDLGYFDEEGYLYLNDRRVDMFTVGGRNVYPAEIEGALSAHPDVLSCLVVGVPDEDLGQVPYALVQAEGLDESDVIDFLAERIAGYKVPRTVEFVDTPLRDEAGKARRTAVRDDVIARRARAHS